MHYKLLAYLICNVILVNYGFTQTNESKAKSTDKLELQRAKRNYQEGNYPESLSGAVKVYERSVITKNDPLTADAGNLIGLIRVAQGHPREGVRYFEESISFNLNVADKGRLNVNYMNMGLAYSELNLLDSALYYLTKSLLLSQSLNRRNIIAMSRNHLGDVYFKKKEYQLAENQYQSVLNNTDYRSSWEDSFASVGMARVKNAEGDFTSASHFADFAFNAAVKAHAKWDEVQALEIAHRAYRSAGNYQTAYNRLLAFKIYADSLFNIEKEKELNSLLLKNKSSENNRLINQIRISQQQRRIDFLFAILALTITLFVILIAYLIYRRYIRLSRLNKKLEQSNKETLSLNKLFEEQNEGLNQENAHKNRMFSIIGHDLRSPFAVVHGTLQLFKSGDLDTDELLYLTDQISEQVESASAMLDSLLVWASHQSGSISFTPMNLELTGLVDNIIAILAVVAQRKKINVIHDNHKKLEVFADPNQLRIILQNLISNAIKYTNQNGSVHIYYGSSVTVELFIKDTGVGMEKITLEKILNTTEEHLSTSGTDGEKGVGLGLQLVRDFAIKNKIILSGHSDLGKGTTFGLTFGDQIY